MCENQRKTVETSNGAAQQLIISKKLLKTAGTGKGHGGDRQGTSGGQELLRLFESAKTKGKQLRLVMG